MLGRVAVKGALEKPRLLLGAFEGSAALMQEFKASCHSSAFQLFSPLVPQAHLMVEHDARPASVSRALRRVVDGHYSIQ